MTDFFMQFLKTVFTRFFTTRFTHLLGHVHACHCRWSCMAILFVAQRWLDLTCATVFAITCLEKKECLSWCIPIHMCIAACVHIATLALLPYNEQAGHTNITSRMHSRGINKMASRTDPQTRIMASHICLITLMFIKLGPELTNSLLNW